MLKARMGRDSITDNLERAVAGGALVRTDKGGYALAANKPNAWYLQVRFALPLECRLLNEFLFQHAYAGSAVPLGCRACFKVKIVPRDFRGLIALRNLLEVAPYHSKCGIDLFNPHSRDIYAGFLYLEGLEAAQAAHADFRARIDADPDLGPDVPMTIKRGCSNYEASCGPSDQWTFDRVEPVEAALRPLFESNPPPLENYRIRRAVAMRKWIQVAWNMRDDSYLAFTGGRPLHAGTLAWPEGDAMAQPSSDAGL